MDSSSLEGAFSLPTLSRLEGAERSQRMPSAPHGRVAPCLRPWKNALSAMQLLVFFSVRQMQARLQKPDEIFDCEYEISYAGHTASSE